MKITIMKKNLLSYKGSLEILGAAALLVGMSALYGCAQSEGVCTGASRFGASGSTQCVKADLSYFPGAATTAATSYDFGSLATTSSSVIKITVKNTGSAKVDSMAVESAPTYPFFLQNGYPGVGGTCKQSLNSGESCILAVQFKPSQGSWGDTTGSGYTQNLKLNYKSDGKPKSDTIALKGASVARCSSSTAIKDTIGSMVTAADTGLQKLNSRAEEVALSTTGWTKIAALFWNESSTVLVVDGFKLLMRKTPGTIVNSFTYGIMAYGTPGNCVASWSPCIEGVSSHLADGQLAVGADSLITTTLSQVGLPLDAAYTLTNGTTYAFTFKADTTGGNIEYAENNSTSCSGNGETCTYKSTTDGASYSWPTPQPGYNDYNVGFKVLRCD